MSPKEKALELIGNMGFSTGISMDAQTGEFHPMYRNQYAKECALIAVDEILWEIVKYADNSREYVVENSLFWQNVKQEIEKM